MPASGRCAHRAATCSTGSGATLPGTRWHRITSSRPMWPRKDWIWPAFAGSVHYDLPWTPARMEQREGRSRRGATACLSTSTMIPVSAALEERLQMGSILDRKRALPSRIGVGGSRQSMWRWRERLAADLGDGPRLAGTAVIAGPAPGLIAGFEIMEIAGDHGTVVGRSMICTGTDTRWGSEASAASTLRWAALQPDAPAITRAERRAALHALADGVRDLLRQHEAAAWWRRGDATARTLLQRLYAMIQPASRARDRARLAAARTRHPLCGRRPHCRRARCHSVACRGGRRRTAPAAPRIAGPVRRNRPPGRPTQRAHRHSRWRASVPGKTGYVWRP